MSSRSRTPTLASLPWRSGRWWLTGLAKTALAFAIVYAPLAYFASHYRIAYDSVRGANCLPYSVFLIDLHDQRVGRGDYVAFRSRRMQPFYADGTVAVKRVVGVPGDRVAVDERGVSINGTRWGELLHVQEGERLWRMGRRASDYARHERIPLQRLWTMGTHPRSFDSRYWGYVADEQVVGRAIPLW